MLISNECRLIADECRLVNAIPPERVINQSLVNNGD